VEGLHDLAREQLQSFFYLIKLPAHFVMLSFGGACMLNVTFSDGHGLPHLIDKVPRVFVVSQLCLGFGQIAIGVREGELRLDQSKALLL
jgi:hypothetical protein